jgi:hypothetical protein
MPMPRDADKNSSSTGTIPGSSADVAYDLGYVRSVRRLSANTDINGNSECSIEGRDCTPHDTMPPDESESLSLDEDENAFNAHGWDPAPKYRAPLAVPRDTHSSGMHGQSRRPPER